MWDNERTDLQARKIPDEKTLAIVWASGEIGLRFRRTEAEDMSRGGQNRTHGTVEYCDRLDSFRDAAQSGRYTGRLEQRERNRADCGRRRGMAGLSGRKGGGIRTGGIIQTAQPLWAAPAPSSFVRAAGAG